MSRRGKPKSTLCVDALLPSLGALSVNTRFDAAALQGIGLSRETILLLDDGDAIEVYEGPHKICQQVIDPEDGKPACWLIPKKDAEGNDVLDGEGKQVLIFNEGLHKRLLWQENASWREWYPPTPPVLQPHQYDYESGWTSYYPSGRDKEIENPHWLRDDWTEKRHTTLAEARKHFAITLQGMLKPHTDKDEAERNRKDAQQKTDMEELQKIMNHDADNTDTSKCGTLTASLFRLRLLLADRKPLSNRTNAAFPLPPGWLPLKKRISPASLEQKARAKQKVGKYAEVFYVGTQWSEWKAGEAPDSASTHSVYSEKSVVQSWLTYLNYQTSASANDIGELAKKMNDAIPLFEANKRQRQENSERAQAARNAKKPSHEKTASKRDGLTSEQKQEIRQYAEELNRMDPSCQDADGSGSSSDPPTNPPPGEEGEGREEVSDEELMKLISEDSN